MKLSEVKSSKLGVFLELVTEFKVERQLNGLSHENIEIALDFYGKHLKTAIPDDTANGLLVQLDNAAHKCERAIIDAREALKDARLEEIPELPAMQDLETLVAMRDIVVRAQLQAIVTNQIIGIFNHMRHQVTRGNVDDFSQAAFHASMKNMYGVTPT